MSLQQLLAANGEPIEMINGWFDFIQPGWPPGVNNIKEYVKMAFEQPQSNEVEFRVFYHNYIHFLIYCEIIRESLGEFPMAQSHLDIGSGAGIIPAFFKASGRCEEVWGIDLLDCKRLDHNQARQWYDIISSIITSRKPEQDFNSLSVTYKQICSVMQTCPVIEMMAEKSLFSLDNYIVNDFMNWDSGGQHFDLITGFSCLNYFDTASFLNKVYSLLNPRGIAFFNIENWYDITAASCMLAMDSPWLHTRISRESLLDYYRRYHAPESEYYEKVIYFRDTHLTSYDYQAMALQTGFQICSCRSIPRVTGDEPASYCCLSDFGHDGLYNYLRQRVLPQARAINPQVNMNDFFTLSSILILKKPSQSNNINPGGF